MKFEEIKKLCQEGYVGMIPGWLGYIKWINNSLLFVNGDYVMNEEELKTKIDGRRDLFYII